MALGLYFVWPVCIQLYSEMNQHRFREICHLVILVRFRCFSMLLCAKIYRIYRKFASSGFQTFFNSSPFINVRSCCHVIRCGCISTLVPYCPQSWCLIPPTVSHGGSCHLLPLPLPSWEQFDVVYLCVSLCVSVWDIRTLWSPPGGWGQDWFGVPPLSFPAEYWSNLT